MTKSLVIVTPGQTYIYVPPVDHTINYCTVNYSMTATGNL